MSLRDRDKKELEFPDLEEEFGEEAVRDAVSTLHRDYIGRVGPHLYDLTIKSRIRGIDYFDRIRVFAAVENRMRGREEVLEALRERREELEEIGERDDLLEDVEPQPVEDVDEEEEEEVDPIWIHEDCGTIVENESAMAWFCPSCEVRTNRVEEIEPTAVDDPEPGVAIADGGEEA